MFNTSKLPKLANLHLQNVIVTLLGLPSFRGKTITFHKIKIHELNALVIKYNMCKYKHLILIEVRSQHVNSLNT